MVRDAHMIERVTRVGTLYDWYGALLTDRQRQMVELYFFDDWSLAEIAESLGISRQAVHDNLRRAEEQLETYEAAVGALRSHLTYQQQIGEVLTVWETIRERVSDVERCAMQSVLEPLAAEYRNPHEEE